MYSIQQFLRLVAIASTSLLLSCNDLSVFINAPLPENPAAIAAEVNESGKIRLSTKVVPKAGEALYLWKTKVLPASLENIDLSHASNPPFMSTIVTLTQYQDILSHATVVQGRGSEGVYEFEDTPEPEYFYIFFAKAPYFKGPVDFLVSQLSLSKPSSVLFSLDFDHVEMSWSAVPYATGYRIEINGKVTDTTDTNLQIKSLKDWSAKNVCVRARRGDLIFPDCGRPRSLSERAQISLVSSNKTKKIL